MRSDGRFVCSGSDRRRISEDISQHGFVRRGAVALAEERHRKRCQSGASFECADADTRYTVRYDDARDAGAVLERIFADRRYRVRKSDARNVFAPVESVVADTRSARDDDRLQRRRNVTCVVGIAACSEDRSEDPRCKRDLHARKTRAVTERSRPDRLYARRDRDSFEFCTALKCVGSDRSNRIRYNYIRKIRTIFKRR